MWPWDWVIAAGNAVSGLSQKAIDWVNSLIASVMSWVTSAINSIWSTISSIWADIQSVWNGLVSFINTVASEVWTGIRVLTVQVTGWIVDAVNGVRQFAEDAYHAVWNALNNVSNFLNGVINQVYRYIKEGVLDPLTRLYNDVKNWTVYTFNRVWQYIQHPEMLVSLIGGYLFSIWLQLVRRYARPVVHWIINVMKSMAGEVFDLLEEVISSVI